MSGFCMVLAVLLQGTSGSFNLYMPRHEFLRVLGKIVVILVVDVDGIDCSIVVEYFVLGYYYYILVGKKDYYNLDFKVMVFVVFNKLFVFLS